MQIGWTFVFAIGSLLLENHLFGKMLGFQWKIYNSFFCTVPLQYKYMTVILLHRLHHSDLIVLKCIGKINPVSSFPVSTLNSVSPLVSAWESVPTAWCYQYRAFTEKRCPLNNVFSLTDRPHGDKGMAGRSSQRGGDSVLQPLPRSEPGAPCPAAH